MPIGDFRLLQTTSGRALQYPQHHLPSWYALYTRHQHEKVIVSILSNKGFETFLPLYTAVHRWKDRARHISLPLFPCYVFLHGGLERRLDIMTTPGLHGFVGSGGLPSVVPDGEIDAVRQVVERTTRVEPHPFLKCGDWVRVKCGPLEGLEGILVRKKNQLRLVLSVELLQNSAAVEVDAWAVEHLPAPGRHRSAYHVSNQIPAYA